MNFTFQQFLTETREENLDLILQGKTKNPWEDVHEILTTALALIDTNNIDFANISTASFKNLLKKILIKIRSKSIIGVSSVFLSLLDPSKLDELASNKNVIENFAAAISAANCIKSNIKNYSVNKAKIYLTGSKWPDDIARFKMTKFGMKDFNSSDLVIQLDNKFIGISLKKRIGTSNADPTLINKSVNTLLNNNKALKTSVDLINKELTNFYQNLLISKEKLIINGLIKDSKYLKDSITKVDLTNIFKNNKSDPIKLLNDLFKGKSSNPDEGILTSDGKDYIRDIINTELKGPNSVFKSIQQILIQKDVASYLQESLTELIFKTSLKDLKDFEFALVTGDGISKINKNNELSFNVKIGEYKPLDSIITKLSKLLKSGKKSFEVSTKYLNKFDGMCPAKLFFTLKIGKVPICDLELRYKGSYTASPQFLGTMTPEFKDL